MFHFGNAPKMERAVELTIALAKKDVNLVKLHVRKDFIWKTVGKDLVISLDELIDALEQKPPIMELNIENALSHGSAAMCEGTIIFEDGSLVYFCNVVKFVNTAKDALVKEAHTYFVESV